MIELKNIQKIYKSKKAKNTVALKDISIKFPEKGLVFILGKSGSGKSTLLNILGGLDKYDSGDLIINEKSTKNFSNKDYDAYRNTHIGFIFQDFNLLENYSIEKNIKLSLELQHKKPTEEEIKNALKEVELEDISKRKTNELSGGQKQRVAIARALIKKPEIILADEPTGNLDSQTSEQIWNILKKASKDKLVIVVSHDTESAEKYADRIIKIQDGEVVSDEGNKEITENKTFKLQSAKLPFFYSFKMALGSIVHKKARLVFSTILIVFSLMCFGVMLSAYSSDLTSETLKLFEENGATEVKVSKYKNVINQIEILKEQVSASSNTELEDKYAAIDIDETFEKEVEEKTGLDWQAIYKIDTAYGDAEMVYPSSTQNEDNYPLYYNMDYEININFLESNNIEISNLIGRKPNSDDEIVISSYVADMIIYKGCMAKANTDEKTEEAKYQPKNYNELISSDKYINIGNVAYLKVVGIIDNSEELSKYELTKNTKTYDFYYGNIDNWNDVEALVGELEDEIYYNQSKFYVNSSFIEKMKNVKNTYSTKITNIKYESISEYSNVIAYIDKSIEVYNAKGSNKISSLNDDEIAINEATLDIITAYDYSNSYEDNKNKYDSKEEFLIKYLKDNEIIGKTIKTNVSNGVIVTDENEYGSYKIIGVVLDEYAESESSKIYYSQKVIEPLITGNVHCQELTTTVNTVDEMKIILKYYPIDDSDELSECKYSNTALSAMMISYLLSFVSKYGVVFFLIFSAIILMNFINSSIKFRKKEIGTLRALGCRSKDIVTMFLYESIILMIVALVIAFILIPKIINNVNGFVVKNLLIDLNILSFGIKQVLEITGIMLIIVILANILPVRRITKMKPIDAILNK
jgi:ABC-type lipoprotein export system ATPase subunit/ABC-type antimicrobial peptide transport system permease subunit